MQGLQLLREQLGLPAIVVIRIGREPLLQHLQAGGLIASADGTACIVHSHANACRGPTFYCLLAAAMPGPLPTLLCRPHALHSRCGRIARGASRRERRCRCLQHCSSQNSHPQAPSQALQHPASAWSVIQVSYVLAKSWCKGARTKSCSSSQLLLNKHLYKRCRALHCTGLHWSSMSTEVGCAQTVLSETVRHHLLHQHGVILGCCVQTLFDLVPAQSLPKQAYVLVKVGCAHTALSETAHCPPAVSIQCPPWLLHTRSGSSCPRRVLRCAGAPECAPAAGCPAPARQSVCLSACPSD